MLTEGRTNLLENAASVKQYEVVSTQKHLKVFFNFIAGGGGRVKSNR